MWRLRDYFCGGGVEDLDESRCRRRNWLRFCPAKGGSKEKEVPWPGRRKRSHVLNADCGAGEVSFILSPDLCPAKATLLGSCKLKFAAHLEFLGQFLKLLNGPHARARLNVNQHNCGLEMNQHNCGIEMNQHNCGLEMNEALESNACSAWRKFFTYYRTGWAWTLDSMKMGLDSAIMLRSW